MPAGMGFVVDNQRWIRYVAFGQVASALFFYTSDWPVSQTIYGLLHVFPITNRWFQITFYPVPMMLFRVAAVGLLSTFLVTNHAFSQAKKPTSVRPATRPATARPASSAGVASIANSNDSLSYSIGYSIAQSMKQQGLTNLNTSVIGRAINDVLKGQQMALSEGQCQMVLMAYGQKQQATMQKQRQEMMAAQAKAAEPNKKAGAEFLAQNKTKPGVQTTASGLQYLIEKEGNGPKPTASDRVKVHYTGTLLDGKVFDSSVQRSEPAEFNVTDVIKGWTEVLQLMPVGSKWKVFIPSDIAYGDRGAGNDIAPGSTLIFDIELLDIVKTN